MDFGKGVPAEVSAYQVLSELDAEQLASLSQAAKAYDLYISDYYRHDDLSEAEGEEQDEWKKDELLEQFIYTKYARSQRYAEQLMLLIEDPSNFNSVARTVC